MGESQVVTVLGIDEAALLVWAAWLMIVTGVVTFVASLSTRAPYGRYSPEAGRLYGPPISARIAWMVQECPSFFVPLLCLLFGTTILDENEYYKKYKE